MIPHDSVNLETIDSSQVIALIVSLVVFTCDINAAKLLIRQKAG